MPRIATLDSIKKKDDGHGHGHGGSDDDDEEEGGNEYFTGGTGNQGHGSGLAVLAPNNDRNNNSNPMRSVVDGIQRQQQRQQQRSTPPPSSAAAGAEGGDRRVAAITLYANGFTLNDGPLRMVDDPANKQFLDNLQQGYCPPELVENGQPADVHITNKATEEYQPPAQPRFQAFAGAGTTLGASSSSSVQGLLVPGTTDGTDGALVVVPATSGGVRVQVKHGAQKQVLTFAPQHTVRHLIGRVELDRPALGPYQLLTGNPPKPVLPDQFDLTLTQAGLAGAMVLVHECDV